MLNVALDPAIDLLDLIGSFALIENAYAGTYILRLGGGVCLCRCRRLVSRINGLFIPHQSKFEPASLPEISWLLSLVVHLLLL